MYSTRNQLIQLTCALGILIGTSSWLAAQSNQVQPNQNHRGQPNMVPLRDTLSTPPPNQVPTYQTPPAGTTSRVSSRRVRGQAGSQGGESYYISDPQLQTVAYQEPVAGNVSPENGQPIPDPAFGPEDDTPIEVPRMSEYPIGGGGERLDLGKTIQKIAFSTLGVLVACVLILIGLKKFGVSGNSIQANAGDSSQVVESINIGSKCVMQLVRIRNYNILIVRDATGIKNVVNLPGSFRDELDQANRNAA